MEELGEEGEDGGRVGVEDGSEVGDGEGRVEHEGGFI